MNRQSIPAVALICALVAFVAGYKAAGRGALPGGSPPGVNDGNISAYFSPRGGCTDAVVEQINAAAQTIKVQAYSFTSRPIAEALIRARKRGVKVALVLDKSIRTDRHVEADDCAAAGIATYVDSEHAIAHNKIMLIDHRTIITGSFNFTTQAEHSNAENLLVIQDRPRLYTAYDENFDMHRGHSEKY